MGDIGITEPEFFEKIQLLIEKIGIMSNKYFARMLRSGSYTEALLEINHYRENLVKLMLHEVINTEWEKEMTFLELADLQDNNDIRNIMLQIHAAMIGEQPLQLLNGLFQELTNALEREEEIKDKIVNNELRFRT